MNSTFKTNVINNGRPIGYVGNSIMRTLVYENILAQKHLYMINIYEAKSIDVNKMIKCAPKTINTILQLRQLTISDTLTNTFEQILQQYIYVNKKNTKRDNKRKSTNKQLI